jgi:hypothetical protein
MRSTDGSTLACGGGVPPLLSAPGGCCDARC